MFHFEYILKHCMHFNVYIILLKVNDSKKKTSSTVGMRRSVETSELLKYRIKTCVPERTEQIIQV